MFRFLVFSFLVSVCHALEAQNVQPNVLLIVSDDQRPDTIGALGNPIVETPHLDEMVRRGISFVNATCANPICTPSRAELLTGCTGLRNGVFDFGRTISNDAPRMARTFSAAGYETWYSGKWHNNGRPKNHGYQKTSRLYTGGGGKWWKPQTDYRGHEVTGYRSWIFRDADDKPIPDLGVGLTPDISAKIADGAIDAIRSSQSPFFVHVNFTAPHDPLHLPPGFEKKYDPAKIPLPKNFAADHPFDHGNRGGRDEVLLPIPRTKELVRADIAAYYAVISHMDAQIGRIMDALKDSGELKSTIVVYTSDHGLAMGSHGLRGKQNMYDHTIRVPMIFSGYQIPSGVRVKGLAYLRDIFPTLCQLAGIETPECDGRSQHPVMIGRSESVYDFVVGYFRDSQRMIRTTRWKLIRYPKVNEVQLFDLQKDPNELKNLAGEPETTAVERSLGKQLDQWLAEHKPQAE